MGDKGRGPSPWLVAGIIITDVEEFTSPATSPKTGDAADQASFLARLQAFANRTFWLMKQIGGDIARPDGVRGVQLIRSVASKAALQALTEIIDGSVAMVHGTGLYQYNAASTITAQDPWAVVPTAVGAGAGRWILDVQSTLGIANGLSQLDLNTKIPLANLYMNVASGIAPLDGSALLPAANLPITALNEQAAGGGTGIVPIDVTGTPPTTQTSTTKAMLWEDALGLHHAPPHATQFVDQMLAADLQGTVNTQACVFRRYIGAARTTGTGTAVLCVIPVPLGKTISVITHFTVRDATGGTVGDSASRLQHFQFKNVGGTVTAAASNQGATATNPTDASMSAFSCGATIAGANVSLIMGAVTGVTADAIVDAQVIVN